MDLLGTRLRMARMSAGMTLRSLATELNICHSTLGHWETGRHVPTYRMLRRLAVATRVDALWIFTGEGCPPARTRERADAGESIVVLDEESLPHVDGGCGTQRVWPGAPAVLAEWR